MIWSVGGFFLSTSTFKINASHHSETEIKKNIALFVEIKFDTQTLTDSVSSRDSAGTKTWFGPV